MRYCGMDVHEESTTLCVQDENGMRVMEETVATGGTEIEALLGPLVGEGLKVALEATGLSYHMHDRMTALGADVQVFPASKLRVIAESKDKCDRNDARWIASLLRTGFHPRAVYIPTMNERGIKDLLNARAVIVRSRVRMVQSVRTLLLRAGIKPPRKTFHSLKGWRSLLAMDLPAVHLDVIREMHDMWVQTFDSERNLERQLEAIAKADIRVERLRTMPGVGLIASLWLVVAIGDHTRFRRSREIGRYFGLTPCAKDSATVRRRGHITREGKPELRAVWLQAALAYLASRSSKGRSLRRWYEEVGKRRGKKIALVALSRKMMVIAWNLLREERPFREEELAA